MVESSTTNSTIQYTSLYIAYYTYPNLSLNYTWIQSNGNNGTCGPFELVNEQAGPYYSPNCSSTLNACLKDPTCSSIFTCAGACGPDASWSCFA